VEAYGRVSDAIWSYAELGLQEFRSSALLIKELEEAGFTVEKGLAGMPTCFVASWGEGKPVIGIMGELDALPGISNKPIPYKEPLVEGGAGHGCGHNGYATTAIGGALAVSSTIGILQAVFGGSFYDFKALLIGHTDLVRIDIRGEASGLALYSLMLAYQIVCVLPVFISLFIYSSTGKLSRFFFTNETNVAGHIYTCRTSVFAGNEFFFTLSPLHVFIN